MQAQIPRVPQRIGRPRGVSGLPTGPETSQVAMACMRLISRTLSGECRRLAAAD